MMTAKGRLRVALIGAGLMGRRRAMALKESTGSELVSVVDMDILKAQALAQEMGCSASRDWESMVARRDVDVVIVSTPTDTLAPLSIAAMKMSKHVLCEKPLARSPEEAKEAVDTALACHVRLKVGFNLRYHSGLSRAKELVEQGAIGPLYFIRGRYGHGGRPGYDREWRTDPKVVAGGEMQDQGIHLADLSRWFLGDFNRATGSVSTMFWDISPLEDNAFAIFQTKMGQTAMLHASWTQWKNLFSFELFGEKGYILVEGLGGNYGTEKVTLGLKAPLSGAPREECTEFPEEDRSCQREWEAFVRALREGKEPEASGHDGWQALRMVYAVYESAKTGIAAKL